MTGIGLLDDLLFIHGEVKGPHKDRSSEFGTFRFGVLEFWRPDV
jgi:hypothetical protein